MAQIYVKPYISKHNRPYWEGLKNKKLLAQECNRCKTQFFPSRSRCPFCLSNEYQWIQLKGTGILYSWSEVFFPPGSYLIGVIELEEGIGRSIARIRANPNDLKINQQVKASFIKFEDFDFLEWIPI